MHPSERGSSTDGGNDFALTMYERLRQRPGSLFFSPFSVRSALCMAESRRPAAY
jgi:serine protease inhibitor